MYTVIVIDDSLSMRRILRDIINSIDEFEVIDEAVDAFDAREKIKKYEEYALLAWAEGRVLTRFTVYFQTIPRGILWNFLLIPLA